MYLCCVPLTWIEWDASTWKPEDLLPVEITQPNPHRVAGSGKDLLSNATFSLEALPEMLITSSTIA
jgi:hypothetical protein